MSLNLSAFSRRFTLTVSACCTAALALAAQASDAEVFATIGTTTLTVADYRTAYNVAARNRFFHSSPPQEEVARFRREVGEQLVSRVLVVEEAKRRGLKPDEKQVRADLAPIEKQLNSSPKPKQDSSAMLEAMRRQAENRSLYEQMQAQVRRAPEPTEAQLKAYYAKNKDKFVEPERVRLAVLLKAVAPGAPQAAWDAAMEEAKGLHKQLAAGADFAQLARRHSADATASAGGDMGEQHLIALSGGARLATEGLKPGELSKPVVLLDGVAIFRVIERKAPRQRSLADVRGMAADLWKREEEQARWDAFVAGLRKNTPVKVNESVYLRLDKPGARSS